MIRGCTSAAVRPSRMPNAPPVASAASGSRSGAAAKAESAASASAGEGEGAAGAAARGAAALGRATACTATVRRARGLERPAGRWSCILASILTVSLVCGGGS